VTIPWHPAFADVPPGELLLYEDADYAGLAIGLNRGSAAERLGLANDAPVRIEPA
jgi:S-adenosylmethionine hydrolase